MEIAKNVLLIFRPEVMYQPVIYRLSQEFDLVFNSYHLGKTKRDASLFDDTVKALGVTAQHTLFVDDNPDHIERAAAKGFLTHLYKNSSTFEEELKRYFLL